MLTGVARTCVIFISVPPLLPAVRAEPIFWKCLGPLSKKKRLKNPEAISKIVDHAPRINTDGGISACSTKTFRKRNFF
jgi:hypothetical protein